MTENAQLIEALKKVFAAESLEDAVNIAWDALGPIEQQKILVKHNGPAFNNWAKEEPAKP